MSKDSLIISEDELSKADKNLLNQQQLNLLLSKTPQKHIYKRKAKGGGTWDFVTGVYVKKVLHLMFGWNWDFEVVKFDFNPEANQVVVLGKLICRVNDQAIVKMQFGRADVKLKKDNGLPLDLGNDFKAATTDALKKCASELGVASDIYGSQEFKEIQVMPQEEANAIDALKSKLSSMLQNCQDHELHQSIVEETVEAELQGTNTQDYYQRQINRLNGNRQ